MAVSLNDICRDFGIRIFSYQEKEELLAALGLEEHAKQCDGFAIWIKGVPVVLFNADMPVSRIRLVAAHEIGHHILGHLTSRLLFWQAHGSSSEREADVFAVTLLSGDLLPL